METRWYLNIDEIHIMLKNAVGLEPDYSNATPEKIAEFGAATSAFMSNLSKEFGIEILVKKEVGYVPNWSHPKYAPLQQRSTQTAEVFSESNRRTK